MYLGSYVSGHGAEGFPHVTLHTLIAVLLVATVQPLQKEQKLREAGGMDELGQVE